MLVTDYKLGDRVQAVTELSQIPAGTRGWVVEVETSPARCASPMLAVKFDFDEGPDAQRKYWFCGIGTDFFAPSRLSLIGRETPEAPDKNPALHGPSVWRFPGGQLIPWHKQKNGDICLEIEFSEAGTIQHMHLWQVPDGGDVFKATPEVGYWPMIHLPQRMVLVDVYDTTTAYLTWQWLLRIKAKIRELTPPGLGWFDFILRGSQTGRFSSDKPNLSAGSPVEEPPACPPTS